MYEQLQDFYDSLAAWAGSHTASIVPAPVVVLGSYVMSSVFKWKGFAIMLASYAAGTLLPATADILSGQPTNVPEKVAGNSPLFASVLLGALAARLRPMRSGPAQATIDDFVEPKSVG